MPPLVLLGLQIVSSFAALGLFALHVVTPHLRKLPRDRALLPLLWVHVPRYVPLALLAPGQTDPNVPLSVVQTIAWGDFSCALLALLAVVALHRQHESALGFVWTFSVVSCLDIVVALTVGLGSGVHEHALGVGWYVLTLYVPLVCISQAMILMTLVKRSAAHVLPRGPSSLPT